MTSRFPDRNQTLKAVYLLLGLAALGLVVAQLPEFPEMPLVGSRTCITGGWKYLLILSHLLNFILIPVAMKVFFEGLRSFGIPLKHIFFTQLGFSLILVGLTAEIGLHVIQCWYYENAFSVLNFLFYFFLLAGFIFWAEGLAQQNTPLAHWSQSLFALGLAIVTLVYYLGDQFANNSFKIPIYLVLTIIFAVLTYRGYRLLQDRKMFLVPLFAVGVNLGFIFLLNQYGGNPYTNPQVIFNTLFHIGHDLAGTQAGLAIFTWLVYAKHQKIKTIQTL